jgi:catechol 2,3-dioxygenase-like lactoylglutathione lyase family enzyme
MAVGWEAKMGGIVFFRTRDLEAMRAFYVGEAGCRLWLDQGACLIFRHGNLLLGFCEGEKAEGAGIITFFYEEKEAVDRMYEKLEASAAAHPAMNEKFRIYHFFARDPEGRTVEFQYFDHALPPY